MYFVLYVKCLFIELIIWTVLVGWGKVGIWGEYTFLWFVFWIILRWWIYFFKKIGLCFKECWVRKGVWNGENGKNSYLKNLKIEEI